MRALLLGTLMLAGCATTSQPSNPVIPVRTQCLPMANYSAADQSEFADQAAGLDPVRQKQVVRFLGDYKAMRDANRACNDRSQ